MSKSSQQLHRHSEARALPSEDVSVTGRKLPEAAASSSVCVCVCGEISMSDQLEDLSSCH